MPIRLCQPRQAVGKDAAPGRGGAARVGLWHLKDNGRKGRAREMRNTMTGG
jgi:hypothetical protein